MKNEKQIIEIVQEAYNRRVELIQKQRASSCANEVIDLKYGAFYTYGDTIPVPQINFPDGNQFDDMELFERFGLLK